MTPIWRALFVATPKQAAHIWTSGPQQDELHSLCGKIKVINALVLEQENPERRHCLSCSDLWVRRDRREDVE